MSCEFTNNKPDLHYVLVTLVGETVALPLVRFIFVKQRLRFLTTKPTKLSLVTLPRALTYTNQTILDQALATLLPDYYSQIP